MNMNRVVASEGILDTILGRGFSIRSDFRFNVALLIFVLWTILQATIPMQILSLDLVKEIEYLKSLLPGLGILICGVMYLDKLKVNNLFRPFCLFCFFVFCNASFRLIFTGGNIRCLAQPIMFIVWTFCMFMLVPSIFDSLSKVTKFLRFSVFTLVFVILFCSLCAYFHEFEIVMEYGGRGLRYSFVYLNPLYFGGMCYTILCGCLMLRELSEVIWEKKLLLLLVLLSFVATLLASSRTYILASSILLLFYFWHKGRFFKKLSWIIVVGCMLFFLKMLWKLSIVENYFDYVNALSSNRLGVWLNELGYMMSDGIEWKALIGNGIYATSGGQAIQLAEGRVAQTFTRFAIDNLYLEVFIMQGAIGLTLFVWSLVRLLAKGNMFRKLKGMAEESRLRSVLSIADGSLLGILVSAAFYSQFPSLGNTINSIVFPAAVAIILIIARDAKLRNKRLT